MKRGYAATHVLSTTHHPLPGIPNACVSLPHGAYRERYRSTRHSPSIRRDYVWRRV